MLDIFRHLLDLIAPPHRVVALLRSETPMTFGRLYSPRLILDTIVLAHYENPLVKSAITANKFHNYQPAAVLLAALLEQWLKNLPDQEIILTPIPLSSAREKTRGYNQVTRVLQLLDQNHISVRPLLSRTKNTPPQTSLGRQERLANMHNVFSYQATGDLPAGCYVVIIDDVMTTGATLEAATAALLPHLPKDCHLTTLAFAH